MNRYYDFFCRMSDEEWENFAVKVLQYVGFQIQTLPAYGIDGGQDFIVSDYYNVNYLVSCKHYIGSGKHVGQDDEKNISDRLLQFNVTGFIGFYSTRITTGLQKRLEKICKNANHIYYIFELQKIIEIMQKMDRNILQSFGLYPHKYYMNVREEEYKPLRCMICGKDILKDENIPNSLVGLIEYKNGEYGYGYGCKPCFINIKLFCEQHWEIEQALYVETLQLWENMVDEWIEEEHLKLNKDFYKQRNEFLNCVRQRQFPQTEGTWQGLNL